MTTATAGATTAGAGTRRRVGARLDTTDDPTGAAIVWPLVMLFLYGLVALGVALVR